MRKSRVPQAEQDMPSATAQTTPAHADGADNADGQSPQASPHQPRPDRAVHQLVDHMAHFEVFTDKGGTAYIAVPVNGHVEYLEVEGPAFGYYLDRTSYTRWQRSLSDSQKDSVIGVVVGRAMFDSPSYSVHCRVAKAGDTLYVDLGTPDWSVVEITPTGWQVLPVSPVRFRRNKATAALPVPEHGGSLSDLRPFICARDEDFLVILAFILACFRSTGPYPIFEIVGEQGGAKSTVTRLIQRLVDPTTASGRGQAKSEQDLAIAAHHRWLIAWDNCSDISHDMSDVLCRLSTGGTFATRTLYSDAGETSLEYCRPCVLNGIANLARRSDLLDRCWSVEVQRIPDHARLKEEDFWAAFNVVAPRIFGAVCDALATALREEPTLTLKTTQRLADAERWACAGATVGGWTPERVQSSLRGRQIAGLYRAVDEYPELWSQLQRLAASGWAGSVPELMTATGQTGSHSTFGGLLKRLRPAFNGLGVDVEPFRQGHESIRGYRVTRGVGIVGTVGTEDEEV